MRFYGSLIDKKLNNTKLHIEHLLHGNGIVAVPGLGTFISRRQAAVVCGDSVAAPSVAFGFENYSSTIVDDDLCISLSRALGCDTTAAADIMADDVEIIRQELDISGRSDINACGSLVREGGVLSFEPSKDNIWLKEIDAVALDIVQEDNNTVDIEAERHREAFLRSLRRTTSSAAALAIFAVLAFIFSQMPQRKAVEPNVASMSFDNKALATQAIGTSSMQQEPSIVLVFNTPADASSPVEAAKTQELEKPSFTYNGEYCLVVASFGRRSDAEDFIRADGGQYEILDKDGRYRVYSMTGDTYSSLYNAAYDAGEYTRHPNAWICRR